MLVSFPFQFLCFTLARLMLTHCVNLFLFCHLSHPLFPLLSFIVCLYPPVQIYIISPPKYSHFLTKTKQGPGFWTVSPQEKCCVPAKVTYFCPISLLGGRLAPPWWWHFLQAAKGHLCVHCCWGLEWYTVVFFLSANHCPRLSILFHLLLDSNSDVFRE